MPVVAPNEGLAGLLANMIKDLPSGFVDWSLILFANDLTPSQSTVYSDIVEPTFGGYSPVTVDHTLWTDPAIVDDHAVSTYTEDPTTWTATDGTDTIYGYAMVTATSPVIKVIERFATPQPITVGGTIAVLPRLTLTTEALV